MPILQLKNKNRVVVVAGCSGSGKSTFAISFLNNAKLSCRFIFDNSGEFALRFKRRACRTVAELNASIGTGWVIFDPHGIFPGEPEKAFTMFCEWAWIISSKLTGQKMIFADEVWKYCDPYRLPKSLALVCQDGRKSGIGFLCTTQRPNRLNESIMGECTEFVGFTLRGENKLGYLRKNLDEFPVEKLSRLAPLHFIAQNMESLATIESRVRF